MTELFFRNNRRKLFDYLQEGQAAIFFAGRALKKLGDEYYPFTPDRNFYYLTGIVEENCIFFFGKQAGGETAEILYIKRDNGPQAKWVGANMTAQEAMHISGIANVRFIDEFEEEAASYFFRNQVHTLHLDLENRSMQSALSLAQEFCSRCKERFPAMEIINIYSQMGVFRLCKEKYELNLMRKAISITCEAFRAMLQNARPGMMEYEIEAYFDYVLKKNGVMDKAFTTIAAAGKNGTTLHYSKNNCIANDGELIMVDAGAQVGYYNGDITRTFPVNGKFNSRQKQVYEIVLEGQRKVIEAIKPGVPFAMLNQILKEHYLAELKEIGLAESMKDVEKYYYHGVSHYLGAETHDVGRYSETALMPGMVLTVEPGLYISMWDIGIRIEDDVLVTETGNEILSLGLPKTVNEIESFMAGTL